MTRTPSAHEAKSLDLINKNEAMAREYDEMNASPDAGLFAAAGWSLSDLAEICRSTAGVLRAILEREGWDRRELADALAERPAPKLRA